MELQENYKNSLQKTEKYINQTAKPSLLILNCKITYSKKQNTKLCFQ
jgi:hypothetical protein